MPGLSFVEAASLALSERLSRPGCERRDAFVYTRGKMHALNTIDVRLDSSSAESRWSYRASRAVAFVRCDAHTRTSVAEFEDGHTKIGRVINANKSIRESYGAHFFNFGNYLYISGINLNFCKYEKNYDPLFNIYHTNIIDFPIEEIEVFSVVKK